MLKVLSVKQPWADMIIKAKEPTEIRSRDTNYRGPLYIQASKTIDTDAAEKFKLDPAKLRTGQIIGKVELKKTFKYASKEVFEKDQSNHLNDPEWYEEPRYGWMFENPEEFEKGYPLKGQLGIFEIASLDNMEVRKKIEAKKGYNVEYIDINKLKPFKRNAKEHPEKQLRAIQRSMEEFGWTNPILAIKHENENLVIAGHARLKTAKFIGIRTAPVIFLDLPYEEAIAYNLADNKLAEMAEWKNEVLAVLLREIDDDLLDATGFEEDEIQSIFDEIREVDEDKIPEVPYEAKTKTGDIYKLGEHRLLCGDSTKKEDINKLMNS